MVSAPSSSHNSNKENIAKYQHFADAYKQSAGIDDSNIFTVAIPTVGPMPKHMVHRLVDMGVDPKKVSKVLREMSIQVIKGNFLMASTLDHAKDFQIDQILRGLPPPSPVSI